MSNARMIATRMIAKREWNITFNCLCCGKPMSPIATIQETGYIGYESAPEYTILYASTMSGSEHIRCRYCRVTHDPSLLEPVLAPVIINTENETQNEDEKETYHVQIETD